MYMKKYLQLILIGLVFFTANVKSQTYASQNISLLGFLNPNTNAATYGVDNRKYSGCWAWYQSNRGKEYAISGSSHGTYFIDITAPGTPTISDFVPGKTNCTWREIKTYQNYCYVASDDASPNTFQIIDMQYLPDSVHVIHNGRTYMERGHTLWVDKDKLYVGSTTYSTGVYSAMSIWSLATPSVPVKLRDVNQDISNSVINQVHDMYVLNDTCYASCGYGGLIILKFNNNNTFSQIGSFTGYSQAGYNHSSYLTPDRKHLIFCDEVPVGLPIHIVNVQNLSNIQNVSTFKPFAATTSHNPYLISNSIAVVSCYQDGLIVYNISNPATPTLTGFFDTHPQGGNNVGNYFGNDYRGNWGAYPWLPSGNVVANDMQNGIFILNANESYTTTSNTVGLKENLNDDFIFFPNPANDAIAVHYKANTKAIFKIESINGSLSKEFAFDNGINHRLDVRDLPNGVYILTINSNEKSITKKLIIQH